MMFTKLWVLEPSGFLIWGRGVQLIKPKQIFQNLKYLKSETHLVASISDKGCSLCRALCVSSQKSPDRPGSLREDILQLCHERGCRRGAEEEWMGGG